MRRGIVIGVLVLSLASSAFGETSLPREPRVNFSNMVKKLLHKIIPLDEILTGSKP